MVIKDHTAPLVKNRVIIVKEEPVQKMHKLKIFREEPKPLKEMKQILKFMKVDFQTEYKFLPDRKFRFDIAIKKKMIGIEYEGLFSNKSRHTTAIGYTGDTIKYNLAVIAGWRVLRYTQLNYKQFLNDLNKIL